MSAPLYSLEESVERSAVSALTGITALSGLNIVVADLSTETDLPMLAARCEKLDEVVLGMRTYNARLALTLTTSADETTAEERAARRLPDTEDDDEGADDFKAKWKAVTDTFAPATFPAALNASNLVYIWGMELEPITYENAERAFTRTVSARIWCNEAYATS